jgi:hypothetical protein
VPIVAVATTGRMKMMTIPVATLMAMEKHLVRRMIGMKIKKTRFISPKPTAEDRCMRCAHVGQETTDDVACCSCCENGEFFDDIAEVEDHYTLDDLGSNWW